MSQMLIPKYIDIEIMMNDAVSITNSRIHFGFEAEDLFEAFDVRTNKEIEEKRIDLKVTNEKENSISNFEIKSEEEKRITLNHRGKSIHGYFEYSREMKANKYLNYENYQFEIKFDIIPKIYINTKKSALVHTKLSISAKILSNYQIIHIKTSNFKISSAFPFCEQKGINLTFSDLEKFDYNNVLSITYTSNKVFSYLPSLYMEADSTNKDIPSVSEEKDFVFKKPLAKTNMLFKKDLIIDKENLLNNIKYLLSLKLKEDQKKVRNNDDKRTTFKNKFVKFKRNEQPLSDQIEDNMLRTYRY